MEDGEKLKKLKQGLAVYHAKTSEIFASYKDALDKTHELLQLATMEKVALEKAINDPKVSRKRLREMVEESTFRVEAWKALVEQVRFHFISSSILYSLLYASSTS